MANSNKEFQPLVCYSEDSDTEGKTPVPKITFPSSSNLNTFSTVKPTNPWQVCVDQSTGYTYYWNMQTNAVTWEVPVDYATYEALIQQWQVQQTVNQIRVQEQAALRTQEELQRAAAKDSSDSDSDSNSKEDKIELITAYGPSSDDESTAGISKKNSEVGHPPTSIMPTVPSKPEVPKSLLANSGTGVTNNTFTWNANESSSINQKTKQNLQQLTKSLSDNYKTDFSGSSNTNSKSMLASMDISTSGSEDMDEDDDEEEDDDLIIARLKTKALYLKELGGEVPKEILGIFDNTKSAEDILAEIEKEIPADHNEKLVINSEDTAAEKPSLEKPNKPLFPIMDYVKKEEEKAVEKSSVKSAPHILRNKTKNIKKIKLSARAKELIKTSLLTAKARATNFVETAEGLKPAEEVEKLELNKDVNNSVTTKDENVLLIKDEEQLEIEKKKEKLAKIKSEISKQNLTSASAENELNNLANSSEHVDMLKSAINPSELNDNQCSKASTQTKSEDAVPSAKLKVDYDCSEESSQTILTKKISSKDKTHDGKKKKTNKEITVSEAPFADIDIDKVLNPDDDNEEKKVIDLSQLIMEKLKFLNDTKNVVSPVQVMAIQIETLVGAWQTGALILKYLSDWLDASLKQLQTIEDAAAPKGWLCEWDRSYGRYYYRNIATGTIQWDFPEAQDEESVKKKAHSKKPIQPQVTVAERPKTPPPPVISEQIVVPPPPVISSHESRKRRTSPKSKPVFDTGKRKKHGHSKEVVSPPGTSVQTKININYSPPVPEQPPLPPMPPKSETPPPPPPPSSPPPMPPPPPVISSNSKLPEYAKYTEKDITVSSLNKDTEKVIGKPHVLHTELDSFYSDIASIESTFMQDESAQKQSVTVDSEEVLEAPKINVEKPVAKIEEKVVKKKKKVKLDAGLSMKKKGLESLVAKWQKVNSDI